MRKATFKKSYVLLATVLLAVCGFFVYRLANAYVLGDPITGLDVPTHVLQLGETTTRTAATTEPGASDWTSSASSTVATIDSVTGVVAAIGAGTTTIAYATSTSGLLNSELITVYAAATIDNPAIGTVQVGEGDVTPTGFTTAGTGQTIAWQSSDTDKATIIAGTGVITPVEDGTTTIGYIVTETATGRIVAKGSLEITVYAAATIDNPAIGTVQVGEGDVTPTGYTAAENGTSTIAWQSSDTDKATIIAGTGVITPVEDGTTTIGYIVTETATGRIVAKGSLEITVEAAEPTLSGIEITTPADVVSYTVGEELDITGLVVTGTYSDDSTSTEAITADNVTGFDSTEPEVDQELTITVGDQNATYTVDIIAIPITAIGVITGTPQFGRELTAGALTPSGATITYQWQSATTFDGTYTNISGATLSTYTPVANDVTKYLKVVATGTGNYSGTAMSAATEFGVATVPLTAIAAITGTLQVGEELTAGALTPSGATVTYQWQRATTSDGTYTDISGATSDTYTLVTGDAAKYLKVAATGTGGYSDTATSAATAATAVVAAAHHGHSSGGGGGTVTTPVVPLTMEQMQAAVDSLIAQINALIVQARARGIQLPPGIENLLARPDGSKLSVVLSRILRPLSYGANGDDVNALQNFLIGQNKGLAAENLKRNGVTTFFGPLTRAALAEFQKSIGLPATGYFGPLTKAYLKSLGF